MKQLPTKKQIEKAIDKKPWDLANKVLYDLCADNFTHDTAEKILAKTLLIGRVYAAAIERRRNKDGINDNFYIDIVVKTFKKSSLDQALKKIKGLELSFDTIRNFIDIHYYLTKLLFDITQLDKRSFSSKYLHFHLPNLFFIYDSRAVTAMRTFIGKLPKEIKTLTDSQKSDREYANFCVKCLYMRQQIFEKYAILLTPRQLDKLLIETANNL